ncbi:MAG TPA: trypsin-like peptidase domain-containing protein, partial [Nitrososphaeraceae archaeon]|nr:trypsin-like peptidase domain-containing protein [Nitrososphaeraceae archaeon]
MQKRFWVTLIAILAASTFIGASSLPSMAQSTNNNNSSNTSSINGQLPLSMSASSPLTLPEIFNKTEKSVVQVTSTNPNSNTLVIANGEQIPHDDVALGSGFVYDEHGHIITNNHVISDPNSVEVTFVDGDSYPAKVIGKDPNSDIAVLKIDSDGFQDKVEPLRVANSSSLQ